MTASNLLTKPNIVAAIEAGYKARQARTQITADATVRAIACLALGPPQVLRRGNLKPIHQLPDDLAASIASIDVVKRTS